MFYLENVYTYCNSKKELPLTFETKVYAKKNFKEYLPAYKKLINILRKAEEMLTNSATRQSEISSTVMQLEMHKYILLLII